MRINRTLTNPPLGYLQCDICGKFLLKELYDAMYFKDTPCGGQVGVGSTAPRCGNPVSAYKPVQAYRPI